MKHVAALLDRHSMVFGTYKWTEFDDDFLRKHVESVALADRDDMVRNYCIYFYLFGVFTHYNDTMSILK